MTKDTEKVLKCAIIKCGGNLNRRIALSKNNFKNPKFSISYINAICEELLRKGYIKLPVFDYDCQQGPYFYLTYEGYSYFETKKADAKRLWLKNAWIPIIVAFITTLITNYILPKLPYLIKWFVRILP